MENNTAIAQEQSSMGSSTEERPIETKETPFENETIEQFILRQSEPMQENKGAARRVEPSEAGQSETPPEAPVTNDDAGNLEHFNFGEDHRNSARVLIGFFDTAMGWIGYFATGMDPERYQRFADKTPPAYFLDATAAMIKKYHARLSLEMMFISALVMAFTPTFAQIRQDRKLLKEKAMEEKLKSQNRSAKIL